MFVFYNLGCLLAVYLVKIKTRLFVLAISEIHYIWGNRHSIMFILDLKIQNSQSWFEK